MEEGKEIVLLNKEKEIVGIALCSVHHYDALSKKSWHRSRANDFYACATIGGKTVFMHTFIMNTLCGLKTPENNFIDHINNQKLDNRVSNLRFVTKSQNAQNRRKNANSTSKFKGVSVSSKGTKRFIAKVRHNKKTIYLGKFITEAEAVKAFDYYVANHDDIKTPMNDESLRDYYKSLPQISKSRNKSQQYISVTHTGKRFRSRIKLNGKTIHIATKDTAIEAARAYDEFIVKNNLSNALNFPEEHTDFTYTPSIKTKIIKEENGTVEISINGKGSDEAVLIDKEDYERIKHGTCHVNNNYVSIYIGGKNYRLHRYLLNENRTCFYVDHINGNTFDNRKNNLRSVTSKGNAENTSKRANCASKYLGVIGHKNKWFACLKHDGKRILFKTEPTELQAACRRDIFILTNPLLKDSCYKLNFEWTQDDNENYKRPFPEYPWKYKPQN